LKTTRNLLIAALLTSAAHAGAMSNVDLAVKGSITPSACAPGISNGGLADFGKISAKDLKPDNETMLKGHYFQFTVTCEGATLMGLQAKDNREGSDYTDRVDQFGLGLINGSEKLGAMELSLSNPVADGVASRMIHSEDGGLTWSNGRYLWRTNILSVADASINAPIPVQQFSSTLRIFTLIAPTSGLNLTEEVPIDGSVTLTLRYL